MNAWPAGRSWIIPRAGFPSPVPIIYNIHADWFANRLTAWMKVMSVRPIEPSTARKYVSWKWRAQSHTSPAVPSAKPPTNASLAQFVVFDEDRGNGGMNNTSPYEDLTRDGPDGFQPYPGVGMVQMQTLDDGALPHDLGRETKVPILMEIGCRKNDKMVAFYTPPLGLLLRIRLGRWPSAHPVGIERTRRQLRPSSRECIAFGLNRTWPLIKTPLISAKW
jgi:hypothetical protein